MKRIIRISMDVHSKSYRLCALESIWGEKEHLLAEAKVAASADEVEIFIKALKDKHGLTENDELLCGYEAGCLGYLPLPSAKRTNDQLCHSGPNKHALQHFSVPI